MNVDVETLGNKLVSVIGAKRSGMAAALLLRDHGAAVFVSEKDRIGEQERALMVKNSISFEEGGHSDRTFEADFSVVSPGIPPHAAVVMHLEKRGITMFSEIEVASWFCPARIIGVTGTDGKTTTATLIAAICCLDGYDRGYRAFSAGNIGIPFSSLVGEMKNGDIAVVELSSYQLERCRTFRPNVAVITNIMPDHLDRYEGSMQRYAEAKYRIYANQKENDWLVYNYDNEILRAHFDSREQFAPGLAAFSNDMERVAGAVRNCAAMDGEWLTTVISGRKEKVIRADDMLKRSFRGNHNLENALAAVAAARVAGLGVSQAREALRGFSGVEHRQEYLGTINGIDWINDSKATNLNALRRALDALPGKAVLIAGGREKGNDFGEIEKGVREKVSLLVAFGESRKKFAAALSSVVRVVQVNSLEEAVEVARQHAVADETVLFSPGCSSFDMFENFEERGNVFKELIREIA